jgi:hypothetical protein
VAPCIAAFAIALAVYLANGETISSYDAVPNSLLAYDVLAGHRLDFDALRNGYFVGLGGQYAFTEAPNGHLASIFPVGTAIVTAPIYAALYAVHTITGQPVAIASPAFEPVRRTDEKLAAAIVAATAVALFFACARSFAAPAGALLATAGFAFGTETWMIGAQGLWQHGSVELVLLAMIFALLAADRAERWSAERGWLAAAGVCGGLLPVVRPTAILFSVAAAAFAWSWFGRRALPAAVGAAIGIAPGIAWNVLVFHSLAGGYEGNAAAYTASLPAAASALAALIVSPSRGLLVFTPLILVAAIGLARALHMRTADARLLCALAAATLALYASYGWFAGWIGGEAFGPRYLTDGMPVAMLLAAYVVPATAAAVAGYAALFAWSAGVQAAGAFSGAAGPLWSAVPIPLAYAPERVWQVHDSQIERNVRAAYYHYAPDYPTGAADYAPRFAGRVLRLVRLDGSALAARPGETFPVGAAVRNSGQVRWYGAATAVYNKEARVRARTFTSGGALVDQRELYVEGSVAPGADAQATGVLHAPASPGTYVVRCDVAALGAPVRDSSTFVENLRVAP